MIKKYIKYFYPEKEAENELHSCLQQIFDFMFTEQLSLRNVVLANVFFEPVDNVSFQIREIRDKLSEFSFDPPVATIAEKPLGYEIAMEVWFIEGSFHTVNFGNNFKMIEKDETYLLFATSLKCCETADDYFSESEEQISRVLKRNRFDVSSIVRQWGYIGEITGKTDDEQNYQIYNNMRSRFYSQVLWQDGYPAATGIGTKGRNLEISIFSVKSDKNCEIFPIKNPRQIDAHKYSEDVIVAKNCEKESPKFERAKVVACEEFIDIFISGTSAIIGQESVKETDIQSQTKATIDNILALISNENIKTQIHQKYHAGIDRLNLSENFSYLRIYLKDLNEADAVRVMCLEAFGSMPMIFLEADVCREELLIEIEGAIFI